MVEIRPITTNDPLYEQEVRLRTDVLLSPIGLDFERFKSEFPGLEERFEHFVGVIEHPAGPMVVGCAALLPNYPEDGTGKLMQMAVHPQRRGEGIGRLLIISIERRAFGDLGLTSVFCHAQLGAIPFYERLGWVVDSEEFEEAGIAHRRMRFEPPPADDAEIII